MKEDLDLLLESLFEDLEDEIVVLGRPRPQSSGNCCTYSYASYNG